MAAYSKIIGLVIFVFGLASLWVGSSREIQIMAGAGDIYTIFHLVLGLGLIIFGLFFAKGHAPTRMERGRNWRYWSGSALYIAVFVAILGALNFIVARYDKRIDLTEQGVYSLAEQSRSAVAKLDQPLKIIGFDVKAERQVDNLRDMLELFKAANPAKVSTEFVNPRAKPQMVEKLGMKGGNLVYLEYGTGSASSISRLNESSEEAITNGILKLAGGVAKKVYYLTGHGEPQLSDGAAAGLKQFADSLKDEHVEIEELLLAQSKTKGVPEDAAAVMWVAPQGPLFPGEKEALEQYVDSGGRLFLATKARGQQDVADLANHLGVTVGKNVVLDVVTQLFAGPSVAVQFAASNFGPHEITRRFTNKDVIVVEGAVSVSGKASSDEKSDAEKSDAVYSELLKTSDNGWGESNLAGIYEAAEPSAEFGAGDLKGPVTIAVSYEKKLGDKLAKAVVFGDSSWLTNVNFKYPAHRDLALNSIGWLAGQESNVTIRPRQMRSTITPISQMTFKTLLQVGFIVPELLVLLGVFVWLRRRSAGAR